MTGSQSTCQATLYLKDDALQPEALTTLLGVEPTSAREKGHRRQLPSGGEVVEKTGMWKLVFKGEADQLSAMVEDLTRYIDDAGGVATELPGVDVGFVDVLLMRSTDEDGGGSGEVQLTATATSSLARSGLPMELTFAVVKP